MTRTVLLLAALLLAASQARAADEFAPIKTTDSVTYPLPPMPLPAVQAPAAGKWSETEDSPAPRASRAWGKHGQAAGFERSEATSRLYQSWKAEVNQSGGPTRSTQASHARFPAAY